ncbi:MAG: GTP 3',8-cyclase MoaA [Nitrospirae bacterium]|nr:MAG: GTP 3',8-cyclase MoaA [Nitrospirota bacterium]
MREALMAQQIPLTVVDRWNRPLRALRLSVTDRCNLRCQYCMPEEDYTWLPRQTLLTFEEMARLTDVFTQLGVDKVRITGGEPLLRKDLPILIRLLRQNPRIQDIALTTNGVLLADQAADLYRAGLHRVTVSLDTLRPDRFKALTKREMLDRVLEGIRAVGAAGFTGLKIDTVVIRGFNDDELVDLVEYGKQVSGEVRFIEYMDVGGATEWAPEKVLSRTAMLQILSEQYGSIEPIVENSSAPAQRFRLPDGTIFGIIASTTTPFCATCDRSRLTADGMWYLCLYARQGIDLREPLRAGVETETLQSLILAGWNNRRDRGAEERKALEHRSTRGQFIAIEQLREDPHLEMHARGG